MTSSLDRVLVTGATGFVGRALCGHLLANGVNVIGIARRVPPSSAHVVRGDVRDRERLESVFRRFRPTLVFHLAGDRARDGDASALPAALEVNALGTVNVVSCSAQFGCSRLVAVGTAEEYGPIATPFAEDDREAPTSTYGISKLAGTRLGLAAGRLGGIEVTVVRPTIAYGPGQAPDMFLPALLRSLVDGNPSR